ncbi:glycoside hydrolase family 3 C-terminal domain-containing protein [Demequina aurantiaca]|uniref:glycoside hydrolase family 3 C-terminal domain-containing protein n=1 Tax=Demequina aurantiaca TaxID=676200 RepID=UPI00078097E0|nr:glycoside hydrolase family 3 C-terminal domain-containing protein [Demequina aurantiaca]
MNSPADSVTDTFLDRAQQVVAKLSTADKIRVVSGKDFWTTEAINASGSREAVPSVMLTDGPHGLRKQQGDTDHVGLADSVPATCFPPAVTLGATWDPTLLEEVGGALGRESRAENVAVLLGPGLNMKRHPAGGRVFEYVSEDPFLAGKMSAGLVRGIQSEGVGACLKHYAVNNQESNRMSVDAVVDERTLRELYLTGFEIAVKESDPWTIMCSYNQVNGTHAGENKRLMTDILRDEWGFTGLAMTDWLATYDRPQAIAAGLDLEMPGSHGLWDGAVEAALKDGSLAMADLDAAATNVVRLALRSVEHDGLDPATASADAGVDFESHHAIARRAAAAGTVLMTNNGILPLSPKGRIAVVGAFAESPRYQGGGSSHVNPTQLDSALDAIREALAQDTATADVEVTYAAGYDAKSGDTTADLLVQAANAARDADAVIFVGGLPSSLESEGFDRANLGLPGAHDRLIELLCDTNPNTVVVLQNGGPVNMPWAARPAAIVEAYLGGQAGGSAIADVLLGAAEPGGRLAESFPVSTLDLPAHQNFPGDPGQVEYREGLFVGYRFHDASGIPARFPFGHGLSYTTFDYSDLSTRKSGDGYTVKVTVTNTGTRAGSEVVQVYVRDIESSVYRPDKELKGFAKVHLAAGASETVTIELDRRAFAIYDVPSKDWKVEAGEFEIIVAASSTDVRASKKVRIASDDAVAPSSGPAGFVATDAEFATLLGHPIPTPRPTLPFHRDSTIDSLQQTALGRKLRTQLQGVISKQFGDMGDDEDTAAMMSAMFGEMPLRGIATASNGKVSLKALNAAIATLNTTSSAARRAKKDAR